MVTQFLFWGEIPLSWPFLQHITNLVTKRIA